MTKDDDYQELDTWFMDTESALSNLGVTEEEWNWMKEREISLSTQYIGLLRIYVGTIGQEKYNLKPVYQIGSILDSISENVLCLEHRQSIVDQLKYAISRSFQNEESN